MSTIKTDRMRLDQVVSFFSLNGYKQTANYFISLINDACTVYYCNAYWVETGILKSHLGDRLFTKLECEVDTMMGMEI